MFENSKNFPILVGFSALLIAGSAAFFSVFGLSKLFAGAQLAVIIMAGSLEFGKLVGASFLYRYWDRITSLHKFYMTTAVGVLIVITSAGIFGFLSNAYQGATVTFEKESTALIYKEDRLEQLQNDKKFLKEELEAAIAELPDNYRTAKRKLREEYQPQINQINKDIIQLKGEVGDLKIALVETGVEVGPAIYIARTFDTDVDTVVKFFILVLIFVFDPMAVIFVISYNVTLLNGNVGITAAKKVVRKSKKKWGEVYGEKKNDILKREKVKEDEPTMEALHNTSIPKDDLPKIDEEESSEENVEHRIARGGIAGR